MLLFFHFLAFLGTSVAFQRSIHVNVLPKLLGDDHVYYLQLECPENKAFDAVNAFTELPSDQYDSADLITKNGDSYEFVICPEGYKIGIAMFNQIIDKGITDMGWFNWVKYPVLLKGLKHKADIPLAEYYKLVNQPQDKYSMTQYIEFGNHFKLDISPKLADASKIVYRVNVYCADNGELEFKTHTQSETIVVFKSNFKTYTKFKNEIARSEPEGINSEIEGSETVETENEIVGSEIVGTKCKKYDVKVWPIFVNWLDTTNDEKTNWTAKSLSVPEFLAKEISVRNGQTYNKIKFANFFNLSIKPPLDPTASPIYYAKIKCNGKANSGTFKTFTHGHTQVVLNEKRCTKYDISLSKLEEEIKDLTDLTTIRIKLREIGVKITNDSTYNIEYTEGAELSESEEEDPNLEDEEEDETLGADDDVNLLEYGIDLDEIMRSLDEEEKAKRDKGEGDAGTSYDLMGDDDDDEDDVSMDDEDMEESDEDERPVAKKAKLVKAWANVKGKDKMVKKTTPKKMKQLAKVKVEKQDDDYDEDDFSMDEEDMEESDEDERQVADGKGKAKLVKSWDKEKSKVVKKPTPKKMKQLAKVKVEKQDDDDLDYVKPVEQAPKKTKELSKVKIEIDDDDQVYEPIPKKVNKPVKKVKSLGDDLLDKFETKKQTPKKTNVKGKGKRTYEDDEDYVP